MTKQTKISDYFFAKEDDDDQDQLELYYAYMEEKSESLVVPTIDNVRKRFGYRTVNDYRLLLEQAENSGVNFSTDNLIRLNSKCMQSRINNLREKLRDYF